MPTFNLIINDTQIKQPKTKGVKLLWYGRPTKDFDRRESNKPAFVEYRINMASKRRSTND